MNKNAALGLSVMVALIVTCIGAVILRYELVSARPGGANSGFGVVYRLDHWTGEVIGLSGFESERIETKK